MIYMSNNNFEQEISQARYQGLHIQEGDVLDIVVSAFDELAVKPFNRMTMNQTSKDESGSQQNPRGLNNEYIVNNDGYISFPVIGALYCKGISQQQLKSD